MPFMNIGDIDLHYEIHGEGFPLLFISGLSGSTWTWEGQIPFFEQHYRCIVFDNRGAGLSGKPAGPYTIAKMAEDALRLLDRLLIEKALVFSLSMGGMIALELARIASGRLGAMLLGCTHAGGKTRIPPSPGSNIAPDEQCGAQPRGNPPERHAPVFQPEISDRKPESDRRTLPPAASGAASAGVCISGSTEGNQSV